jgi:hypothetical protein
MVTIEEEIEEEGTAIKEGQHYACMRFVFAHARAHARRLHLFASAALANRIKAPPYFLLQYT